MSHVPFGSFNPNFYGITLITDPAKHEILKTYHNHADVQSWSKGREDKSVEQLGVLSAADHEVRHFHDFLLSPFCVSVMALRMQATLNGIQALLAMENMPGKYIPAPIVRWMEWDDQHREEWFESTGKMSGVSSLDEFVALPTLGNNAGNNVFGLELIQPGERIDEIADLVSVTSSAYTTLDRLREPLDLDFFSISVSDIFEATAHIIQAQAIWTGQGEDACAEYIDYLHTSENEYLKPYRMLNILLSNHGIVPTNKRLCELFTWMLLAPVDEQLLGKSIGLRCEKILKIATNNSSSLISENTTSVSDFWDSLDHLTGQDPWRDNLVGASDAISRRLARYREIGQSAENGMFDDLVASAEIWARDQVSVRSYIESFPDRYSDPFSYITGDESSLPFPLFENHFGWMVHRPHEILQNDRIRAILTDESKKEVIAYVLDLKKQPNVQDLETIVSASEMHRTVDFCFYEELVDSHVDTYFLRRAKRLVGKEFIHVY